MQSPFSKGGWKSTPSRNIKKPGPRFANSTPDLSPFHPLHLAHVPLHFFPLFCGGGNPSHWEWSILVVAVLSNCRKEPASGKPSRGKDESEPTNHKTLPPNDDQAVWRQSAAD